MAGTGTIRLQAAPAPTLPAIRRQRRAVTVSLAAGTATGQGSDTLTDIENITGSAYADTLTGDGNANVLSGGAGGDALDGGAGADTADYTTSTAAVTIDLQNGTASGGDAASDTLTSIENVTGSNTAAAIRDTIYGDANANTILALAATTFWKAAAGPTPSTAGRTGIPCVIPVRPRA